MPPMPTIQPATSRPKKSRGFLLVVPTSVIVFSLLSLKLSGQDGNQIKKPLFRVGVETVFVHVSVTDPMNRIITGLGMDSFTLYEDKVEQNISFFHEGPAPVSVGILFDVSGSMRDNGNLDAARQALSSFIANSDPEDEYFLLTFNEKPRLAIDFTREGASIPNEVAFRQPGGRTALYDAVYLGLTKMREAHNDRKALILISDGEENSSRYPLSEIMELAKESGAQIYSIGEPGKLGYGRSEIESIVELSGGRAFFPGSFSELEYYIDLIHCELRNQYVLGYNPSHKDHDGKWRRIRIKLDAPEGLPKLAVRARKGYIAAGQ